MFGIYIEGIIVTILFMKHSFGVLWSSALTLIKNFRE
jgi:hypothetical protein